MLLLQPYVDSSHVQRGKIKKRVVQEQNTEKKMWKVVMDASNRIETDYGGKESTRYQIESIILN